MKGVMENFMLHYSQEQNFYITQRDQTRDKAPNYRLLILCVRFLRMKFIYVVSILKTFFRDRSVPRIAFFLRASLAVVV